VVRYVNKEAFDQHMGTPVVAIVMDLFKSKPQLLGGPGSVAFTTTVTGVSRITVDNLDDPIVVYATLDYKPNSFEEALSGWREIAAETDRTEPKVHMYNVLKDNETDNRVRMFEAYEDMAAFEEHCSTDMLKRKIKVEQNFQAKAPDVIFLKRVKGFLYKGQQKEEMQRL